MHKENKVRCRTRKNFELEDLIQSSREEECEFKEEEGTLNDRRSNEIGEDLDLERQILSLKNIILKNSNRTPTQCDNKEREFKVNHTRGG